ncbi:MAG: ribonuclease P protein component [Flavobacteriales bacterium]|jgi:ribonuclease P protein component|nr:ribonuclease P protein component [Flavobacteriales bacterium]
MANTFSKSERICSQIVIDDLFKKGKILKSFPFLVRYLPYSFNKGAKVQIVISVPKRKVKKAVDRNRLKRQIREVYRLNKKNLLEKFEEKEEGLALFLIYTGPEKAQYQDLEKKLKLLLHQLENLGS